MTQQFMQLILGGTDDALAPSSSNSPFKLYHGGDTLRLKQSRIPGDEGYVGEICWSINSDGNAMLHLCTSETVYNQDGIITTPAVWQSLTFTQP